MNNEYSCDVLASSTPWVFIDTRDEWLALKTSTLYISTLNNHKSLQNLAID